ncbi:MAG: Modification methylase RsrI [candidate division BRC1 bacterium ADurb.BinA364]|nr:MAG: Modification methylase RsrI [candidate division BRC1 bacterium ADurb.BinA364]
MISKHAWIRQHDQGLRWGYAQGDCVAMSRECLAANSVDLIVTDPPYGIEGDTLHKHYNRDESFVIDGYVEIPEQEYESFSKRWIGEAARVLRPGGSMYIVSGWTHLRHLLNALNNKPSLELVNHIVWKYNFGVFTRKKFVTSHYHILYCVKTGAPPKFNTYARFSPKARTEENRSILYADMEDVWIIDREYKKGQVRHKNELPSALLMKMMQYSSEEGDLVCDFFAGSFSTAKIAKGLRRSCVCFEISPEACAHQAPEVDKVEWGELIEAAPQGAEELPSNYLKPWSARELERLAEAYDGYRDLGLTKKTAIDNLQNDFGRGYFAVLNALKKRGR